MLEHPVPQNITAYQFRLIGNMTIKQFLLLLAGAGLAFLAYTSNLPFIIKIPLAIIAVIGGIALAFVPYEERTLDEWFINFIKAIYRPTKYYWRRKPHTPDFFTYTPSDRSALLPQADLTPYRKTQVQQFLTSISQKTQPVEFDPLDLLGAAGSDLNSLFSEVQAAANVTPGAGRATKPNLQARPRPLRKLQTENVVFSPQTMVPQTTAVPPAQPVTTSPAEQVFASAPPETPLPPAPTAPEAPSTVLSVSPQLTVEAEHAPTESESNTPREVQVEKLKTIDIVPTESPVEVPTTMPQPSVPTQAGAYQAETTASAEPAVTTTPIVFNKELPFPSLPDQPNLLIGMVHDKSQGIVPGAIVEIEDEDGNTVRAMKTNSLGQFYISSPLKAGKYLVKTEKDTLVFPVYSLELTDTVLDPVDITALA